VLLLLLIPLLLTEPSVSVTVSQVVVAIPAPPSVTVTVAFSVVVRVTMVMSEPSRMTRRADLGAQAAPLTAAVAMPKWMAVAAAAKRWLKSILVVSDVF
jgi:hypothetical protein